MIKKIGKTIYVKKDLVAKKELNFELYDEFNYDYDNDEFNIINAISNPKLRNGYYVDTTLVKISELEKLLDKFKKKGATHITMSHHEDHHGYEFSGFNIELANDELIKRYKDGIERKLALTKEYQDLNVKLADVRAKINDLRI